MPVGRRRCNRQVKTDSEMGQRFQRYLKGLSPEEKNKYKGLKCHQAKALFRVQRPVAGDSVGALRSAEDF